MIAILVDLLTKQLLAQELAKQQLLVVLDHLRVTLELPHQDSSLRTGPSLVAQEFQIRSLRSTIESEMLSHALDPIIQVVISSIHSLLLVEQETRLISV